MRLALRITSFKQLTSGLDLHEDVFLSSDPDESSLRTALQVAWAVNTATRFVPWRATCLEQVLTAQRMLESHAIAGAIYIGAAAGSREKGENGLEAHAWLRCGVNFIAGEKGHERYTVVTTFSWGQSAAATQN